MSLQLESIGEERDTNVILDRQVHGANIGPTWVLSAPAGPDVGPMNLAIRDATPIHKCLQLYGTSRCVKDRLAISVHSVT